MSNFFNSHEQQVITASNQAVILARHLLKELFFLKKKDLTNRALSDYLAKTEAVIVVWLDNIDSSLFCPLFLRLSPTVTLVTTI